LRELKNKFWVSNLFFLGGVVVDLISMKGIMVMIIQEKKLKKKSMSNKFT
jgi:hypothetical protein